MSDIEIGQVLSLKVRYNNAGTVSTTNHPYLVVDVDDSLGVIEIAQIDSLAGKEYKAAMRCNKTIFGDDPKETVIDKDSYVQLDNTFRIENIPEIVQFRRQEDKLSQNKLSEVLTAYKEYHETQTIEENKNVYMDRIEILALNTRGPR